MNNRNQFFKRLYSSPSMLWKAGAGVLFLILSVVFALSPEIINGLTNNSRYALAALLAVWGLFRLITFYNEYKRTQDE